MMNSKHYMLIALIAIWWAGFSTLHAQVTENSPKFNDRKKPKETRRLTPEMLREQYGDNWQKSVLDYVRQHNPEEYATLQKDRDRNPAKFENKLLKNAERMVRLEELRVADPDRYENEKRKQQLEIAVRQLSREYQKAEDEKKRKELKAQLWDQLEELFTLREAEKKQKIERLEKELQKLKEIVELRQKKKDEIINNRLNELIGQRGALRW